MTEKEVKLSSIQLKNNLVSQTYLNRGAVVAAVATATGAARADYDVSAIIYKFRSSGYCCCNYWCRLARFHCWHCNLAQSFALLRSNQGASLPS